MKKDVNPLLEAPPEEVFLARAPLKRVLTQVRFPSVLKVEQEEFVGEFQEGLRHEFPILRAQQNSNIVLPGGIEVQASSRMIWRFYNKSQDSTVTLAKDFIALETEEYRNRDSFLKNLSHVLDVLNRTVSPGSIDRIGIRYINLLEGEDVLRLKDFIRPELAGVLTTSLESYTMRSLTETVFDLPEESAKLALRCGRVPAGTELENSIVPSSSTQSWHLDLDAYRAFSFSSSNTAKAEIQEFDVKEIVDITRSFANRVYGVFRWAVTDTFLERFGEES